MNYRNGFWTSTYAFVKVTHDQTKPTRRWFYFTEWEEQTSNIWNALRQMKEVLFLSETYLIIPCIGLLLRCYLLVPTKEILSRLSINLGYSLMVLDSYSYDNVWPQLTPINSYSPVQCGQSIKTENCKKKVFRSRTPRVIEIKLLWMKTKNLKEIKLGLSCRKTWMLEYGKLGSLRRNDDYVRQIHNWPKKKLLISLPWTQRWKPIREQLNRRGK